MKVNSKKEGKPKCRRNSFTPQTCGMVKIVRLRGKSEAVIPGGRMYLEEELNWRMLGTRQESLENIRKPQGLSQYKKDFK